MLATKNIYLKNCLRNKELHTLTSTERNILQSHLKIMYKEIETVCDRHGLMMCTGYGTVLGALRHHGFIPWDDDMDLLMPRADYDKLINEYASELPKNFRIYAPNSEHGPIARFAKVVDTNTRFIFPGAKDEACRGIFIDIFPIENTPANMGLILLKRIWAMLLMLISSSVELYQNYDSLYMNIMCSSWQGRVVYGIRNIFGFIFSFSSYKTWYDRLDRFLQHSKDTSTCSVPSGDGAKMKYFYPYDKSLYFPAQKMKFEDIEVYVPNQAERHCEIEYGDWHWIPPVEDRWQHFIKEIRFAEKVNL